MSAYAPAEQLWQTLPPATALYVPVAQLEHSEAPAAEDAPTAHNAQAEAAASEKEPDWQSWQEPEPALAWERPELQAEQALAAAAE